MWICRDHNVVLVVNVMRRNAIVEKDLLSAHNLQPATHFRRSEATVGPQGVCRVRVLCVLRYDRSAWRVSHGLAATSIFAGRRQLATRDTNGICAVLCTVPGTTVSTVAESRGEKCERGGLLLWGQERKSGRYM